MSFEIEQPTTLGGIFDELSALDAQTESVGQNLPSALASAAYGYTRGGQHSVFTALVFGFFGYSYPLVSTLLFAADAVFVQQTPARAFAIEQLKALRNRRQARTA